MIYRVGFDKVAEQLSFLSTVSFALTSSGWKVIINNKTGSFLRQFDLYSNKLKSFSFSVGEKGCLDGNLKFNKIDFPVYINDEVLIYYNNVKKYRGYVSNIPLYSQPDQLKIEPYLKKIEEIYINESFTGKTFKEMLSTILSNYSTLLNIYYNETMVKDYTHAATYSVTYSYETVKKFIEDYIEKVDDVYYGIEENGFFFIRKRSTTINHVIYSGHNQKYGSFTYKKDYSKIKNTRYHIFKRGSNAGQVEYVDTIPDGSASYPYSSYENIIGIKEDKLTAPKGLSDVEVKDYAYAKITAQRAPENLKIKDVDIRRFDGAIGEKVRFYEKIDYQLKSYIDCETTANWSSNITSSTNSIENSYCMKFDSSNKVYYYFTSTQRFEDAKKIGFFIKSKQAGNYLNFVMYDSTAISLAYSMGSYGVGYYSYLDDYYSTFVYSINIKSANTFNYVEVPFLNNCNMFSIQPNTTILYDSTVYIDDIRLFAVQNNYYDENILIKDYEISKDNVNYYDMELGDYDPIINDLLFDMEKKIKQLEVNQQT